MKKAIIALSTLITLAACHANYDKAPSGLVYKVYPGKGGIKVSTAKFVKINIEYTLKKNGKDSVISTTFGKMPQYAPIDTTANRVGYTYMEILPKCHVGDSVVFSLSIDTLKAHNVQLPPGFNKGDFITGRIKILHVFTDREEIMADYKKEQEAELVKQSTQITDYLAKNNITGAQKTKNGAYVLVENAGTDPKADTGKQAMIKYKGYLLDGGTVFDTNVDSSKGHTDPIPVTIGAHGVIPGWEECLPYLGKGGKAKFFIPAGLGYGPQGNGAIPPNAALIFDVEVVDVKIAPPPAAPGAMQGLPGQRPGQKITVAPPAKPAHK